MGGRGELGAGAGALGDFAAGRGMSSWRASNLSSSPFILPLPAPPPPPAGELAIKCGAEELKPFALQALERLAQILQVGGLTDNICLLMRMEAGASVALWAGPPASSAAPRPPPTRPQAQVPTGGLPRSLVENAAITLGRLAWMCPEPLAPHAAAFLGPW